MKTEKKNEAIKLRKQGLSYNEICDRLDVAKSTCSVWLRGIKLSKTAIQRLADRQKEGQKRSSLMLRQYRQERDEFIQQKVEKELKNYKITQTTGRLLCAALYWAEGGKTGSGLYFANSDPQMIQV